ncbi:MAG: alpha/beta fold hydrolase [Planctomycetota bacterium]|nr:alpha/beta fold hydrolase [Planctomycetota bacterium]
MKKKEIAFGVSAFVLLFVSIAVGQKPEPGQQVNCLFKYTNGEDEKTMKYDLFVPKNYQEKNKFPLMLFLHGAGERGNDLTKVRSWGPPKLVKKRKDFPFIVISPQCPKASSWTKRLDGLEALVRQVAGQLKVDQKKIYCTGLSMGGFGTWALCAKYPKLFAAAVPICGGGRSSTAAKLKDLPIWVFHGDADRVVPYAYSEKLVQAIKKAGGTQVKFTTYKGVGHNSWSQAYATEELYKWLLSHSRRVASSKPQKANPKPSSGNN